MGFADNSPQLEAKVKWYAAVLLTLALAANAETITGRVVGVADSDTITVLDADKVQHKIRLSDIDAPEKKQPQAHSPRGRYRVSRGRRG